MRENYFKNENVEIWIENGILYVVFAPDLVLTEQIARDLVIERIRISKGQTYPMLCVVKDAKTIEKAARDYLSTGDAIRYLSAGAFITNTYIEVLLTNAFLRLNNPPLKSRLFTDQKEAIRWLEKFKNLN